MWILRGKALESFDVSGLIRQASKNKQDILEDMLSILPKGSILCVHEPEVAFNEENNTYRFSVDSHILNKHETCDAPVIHTQYQRVED